MVAKTTHPLESEIILADEMVSQYLQDNPDFFIRHPELSEIIQVPHRVKGAVSLLEWQMTKQRRKINELESEITLLMENASTNEKLIEQLMTLKSQIWQTENLDDLVKYLNNWAKSLGLMGAYLYLFDHKWQLDDSLGYQKFALSMDKFDVIRIKHLQFNRQYLGMLNSSELKSLLPKHSYVGSVALSLLGKFGDLGLILFASRNPQHYQAGQGTLLLEKIAEILPIFIDKWVMRKIEGK